MERQVVKVRAAPLLSLDEVKEKIRLQHQLEHCWVGTPKPYNHTLVQLYKIIQNETKLLDENTVQVKRK